MLAFARPSGRRPGPIFGAALCALLSIGGASASADIILTNVASTYAQNFDTLASTGTSTALPNGWLLLETGANANGVYNASNGSAAAGNVNSFGATASTERAFGGVQTPFVVPAIGAVFQNGGNTPIINVVFNYIGEQWRLGRTGRIDQMDFQYSTDATSLSTGTWTDLDALDFVAPISTGPVGALNGNAAANQVAIGGSLAININPGSQLWIRWNDFNAAGNDDGLGIDNFSAQATFVPEPSAAGLCALGLALGMVRGRRRRDRV